MWQEQTNKFKKWQTNFKFTSELEVGDKVDIRTLDYVWGTGTIKLIIEQMGKDPLLVIHKEGFSSEWDELLYRNSPRVAVHGSYSLRNDIPRYVFEQNEPLDDPDPESTDAAEDAERMKPKIINNIVHEKNQKQILSETSPDKKQNQDCEAMANINDFLNQYEENNADQTRMQRWATAQQKRTRPVFFKAFVEGLSQQSPQNMGSSEYIDILMGTRGTPPIRRER